MASLRRWSLQNGVPCVDDEDGLTLGMGKIKDLDTRWSASVSSWTRHCLDVFHRSTLRVQWKDDHIQNAVCYLSK